MLGEGPAQQEGGSDGSFGYPENLPASGEPFGGTPTLRILEETSVLLGLPGLSHVEVSISPSLNQKSILWYRLC